MRDNTVISQLIAQRPGIDLEEFRRKLALDGLEGVADQLIGLFLQDAPSRFEALENAIVSGDAEEIRCAAHAYRSAASTMHARKLAGMLLEVEAVGRSGDGEPAGDLLAPLRSEHEEVLRQLRESGAGTSGS